VTGCYIVNIILDDEGEEVAARLHYQKINTPMDADDPDLAGNGGVGTVFAKLTFWEVDGWDDRGPDPS
jgi:hypothetical protein